LDWEDVDEEEAEEDLGDGLFGEGSSSIKTTSSSSSSSAFLVCIVSYWGKDALDAESSASSSETTMRRRFCKIWKERKSREGYLEFKIQAISTEQSSNIRQASINIEGRELPSWLVHSSLR
jgi:hypothetical protein